VGEKDNSKSSNIGEKFDFSFFGEYHSTMQSETLVRSNEAEIEKQFQEIAPEVLAEHGWQYYKRVDGHVFTVVVTQGTNLERAFAEGRGIYAKHQMKAANGRELLPGAHIEIIAKGKIQRKEIMCTTYDPSIGHPDFIVLTKTA